MSAYKLSVVLAELGLLSEPLDKEKGMTTDEALQSMLEQVESRLLLSEPPSPTPTSQMGSSERRVGRESDEIFFESPLLREVEQNKTEGHFYGSFAPVEFDELTPSAKEEAQDWVTEETLDDFEEEGKVYFDPIEPPQREVSENLELKELLSVYPNPMWVVDAELCLVDFNEAYEEMLFGASGIQPVLGENVLQWGFPTSSLQETKKLYERAFAGQTQEVFRSVRVFGEELQYRFLLQPLLAVKGKQKHICVVAEEHTALKRAEEKKESLQRHFDSLLETGEELTWGLDREMRFLFMNSSFRNSYLRRSYVLPNIGEELRFELFPKEVAQLWKEYYQRAFQGESFVIHRSREIRQSLYFFEYAFQPILNESQSVIGVCVKGRNISQLEESLQELQRRLKVKSKL